MKTHASSVSYPSVLVPNFRKRGGSIPVVVQHHATRDVLMLAYADEEAFRETLRTGYAVFRSTSRGRLWRKGETSGNTLRVRKILVDCDGDALVYIVDMRGPAVCHTGRRSCFWRSVIGGSLESDEGNLEVEIIETESGLAGSLV